MNRSHAENVSVPELMNKLCNHFAKNNTDVCNHLFKVALNFLTSPTSANFKLPTDEQYITSQIKRILTNTQANSEANVRDFEMLYAKLQQSTILRNKVSVLTFVANMSSGCKQNDVNMWSMIQELHQLETRIVKVKPRISFDPKGSKESVKRIYSAPLAKRLSHATSAQSTVQSSWSNSDELQITLRAKSSIISNSKSYLSGDTVTEDDLIQEVIYSFQGIEGRILRKEPGGFGFTVDPIAGRSLTIIQRGLLERLSGIGFLHNQLRQHCDEADKQMGIIGQSLIATFRDELTEHYRLVAILQVQLKKQSSVEHSDLTLRRMVVWVAEEQLRLQWLAYIAEQCNDKKGGALISAIHGFLQHGSICTQKSSAKVLSAVCRPLYHMMSRWLLDGELKDPCGEFFIETRSINIAERLWHDKYHVRMSMVPSFITLGQAKKILATGKSINFLRQICKDTGQLPGTNALQKLFTDTSAEALFSPEQSIELHNTLDSVYRETSLRVLDLLRNKYGLLVHLQALRKYLLLGQGDFIRHLLELLAPELSKPAQEIYGHTLSAILESAIRVTNAQFEDEDILRRLNVALMDHSHGDTGWDVFRLVYIFDGPVGTIFQSTMTTYKDLFGALWKAKRMEYVLSNMRKLQITTTKLFRNIKELKPVTHAVHMLSSEMIHFLHQTQYYFLFEVLECSWAEMLNKVNQAESLDDIISAHAVFLDSVECGVLIDGNSKDLCSQLRIIYNLILSLEAIQGSIYTTALREHESFIKYLEQCEKSGTSAKQEMERQEKRAKFHQFLISIKCQVKQLAFSYNDFVKKYLYLLATSTDLNLQLLSVRLNFNDHYNIT